MMKLYYSIFLLMIIVGFFVTGCAAPVHVEKDKQINFSRYKTFAWINGNDGKKSKSNDAEDKSVHVAVSRALQKTSWKEVVSNPDLLISYDVLIERADRTEDVPVYSPAASRLYYNPYTRHYGTIFYPTQFRGYNDYNVPVKEGTLTLTITDAVTDKTVWQAWTTDQVKSRRLSHQEIDAIVKSIFRKFDIAGK